jgi:FAD binding domain
MEQGDASMRAQLVHKPYRLSRPTGGHTNSITPPLNDIHSRLNVCEPALYRRPRSVRELFEVLNLARRRGLSVSVAGGRHAMGGQQFLSGGCVVDMRALNRILDFNQDTGLITVQSGIIWPELMRRYLSLQSGEQQQWGIRQKQTGADSLTVGGAIAANIHGRGLDCAPFSCDVESMQVITPRGDLVTCSRLLNADLFRMVVGGYGLFGIITAATLRLVRRQKVQRVVALLTLPELMTGIESRINDGYTYGDFQFATDPNMSGFLRDGIFSCYQPIDNATSMPRDQIRLSRQDWQRLLYLGHVNKRQAFLEFSDFYLRSSGQVSDNSSIAPSTSAAAISSLTTAMQMQNNYCTAIRNSPSSCAASGTGIPTCVYPVTGSSTTRRCSRECAIVGHGAGALAAGGSMAVFKPFCRSCHWPNRSGFVAALVATPVSGVGIRPHSLQRLVTHSNCADCVDDHRRNRPLAGLRVFLGDTPVNSPPAENHCRNILHRHVAPSWDHRCHTTPLPG